MRVLEISPEDPVDGKLGSRKRAACLPTGHHNRGTHLTQEEEYSREHQFVS